MSSGLDLSQFFETFFDEAGELLAEMETQLLELDIDNPDSDLLNAIFRAAHSIKGGAGTFGCFEHLADTTHLFENVLDLVRNGDMPLRTDMIDLFLETKDVLSDQVTAYRNEEEPDIEAYERICAQLRQLAEENKEGAKPSPTPAVPDVTSVAKEAQVEQVVASVTQPGETTFCIRIANVKAEDIAVLKEEMALMGGIVHQEEGEAELSLWVSSTATAADLTAVCCFVVNEEQLSITEEAAPTAGENGTQHDSTVLCIRIANIGPKDIEVLTAEMRLMGEVLHSEAADGNLTLWLEGDTSPADIEAVCGFVVSDDQVSTSYEAPPVLAANSAESTESAVIAPDSELATTKVEAHLDAALPTQEASVAEAVAKEPNATQEQKDTEATPPRAAKKAAAKRAASAESSTIRVGVERVDQIINLVGELVITQAMLSQTASSLDPVVHDRLINGVEQLERNARDLQESVMAIRMMPMDYVFSRFPRVVRENASRMKKQIRLVTKGQSTELDKSLIERIIDPLTHLVRNSIDHGIETPEKRIEVGKDPEGTLTLSAQHQGGHIVIEVIDDGGGLNREKILAKAMSQGLTNNENIPDDELWQLLFAPGFSTAEQVTDISGRGVGMDVVRRNIQSMGGNVQMFSRAGLGSTTRIVLPLTLAILDGMSVRVGEETFILPLSHVTESIQPSSEQVHKLSNNEHVLHVRGEYLPIVALSEVFTVDGAEYDMTKAIAVILQAEDMRFALIVDDLIGQHQVVVKNLEANYRKIPGISAATILGDGSVALIVDVFALNRLTRERKTNISNH